MEIREKINAVLRGETRNYVYPFFWPDENRPEGTEDEVEAVYRSGCRGLCLEARPFENFGKEQWWDTVKRVLEAAKKRGMKVWILDDKHFPTGFANGFIKDKYPRLRRRWLYEHHFDVYGEVTDYAVCLPETDKEYDTPVCAVAYRRTEGAEQIYGEPLPLTLNKNDSFVRFDLPEGFWRVFVVFESTNPDRPHGWYTDMLSKESSAVLIEAVYESHYARFSEYFGNTLEGFFSDEPSFNARHTQRWESDPGFYFGTVGVPGMSLPWNETVEAAMKKDGFSDLAPCLPLLWYDNGEISPKVRFSYMDTVTRLWQQNFSYALGDWCRARGLIYTGHIIEDNNAHSRLSASAGHYFRGLSGQDISGVDVVLIQVVPGMSGNVTAAAIAGGRADGRFFHYTLAHLASSLSRLENHMRDRAMCELFGAFGWAESVPFMKWMTDFLLIRGINRFVPHAFSVKYPFDDCPPHFYAGGCNPQFEGFSALIHYMNAVSTLLDGADRQTPGAIFYYAENEWLSGKNFIYGDGAAKALYDAHTDYDIVPLDSLEQAEIKDGSLYINGKAHRFLVIPEAERYSEKLISLAQKFIAAGLPVFTFTERDFGNILGQKTDARTLAQTVIASGLADGYCTAPSKLRIAHWKNENADIFYLFNEEPVLDTDTVITVPASGFYTRLELLGGGAYSDFTPDGKIRVKLKRGESVIFVFDGKKPEFTEKKRNPLPRTKRNPLGYRAQRNGYG